MNKEFPPVQNLENRRNSLTRIIDQRKSLIDRIGTGSVKVGSSFENTLKVGKVRKAVTSSISTLTQRLNQVGTDIQNYQNALRYSEELELKKTQLDRIERMVAEGLLTKAETQPHQIEFQEFASLPQKDPGLRKALDRIAQEKEAVKTPPATEPVRKIELTENSQQRIRLDKDTGILAVDGVSKKLGNAERILIAYMIEHQKENPQGFTSEQLNKVLGENGYKSPANAVLDNISRDFKNRIIDKRATGKLGRKSSKTYYAISSSEPEHESQKANRTASQIHLDKENAVLTVGAKIIKLTTPQFMFLDYIITHSQDKESLKTSKVAEFLRSLGYKVTPSYLVEQIEIRVGQGIFKRTGKNRHITWSLIQPDQSQHSITTPNESNMKKDESSGKPALSEEKRVNNSEMKMIILYTIMERGKISAEEIIDALGPSRREQKLTRPQALWALQKYISIIGKKHNKGTASEEEAKLWQKVLEYKKEYRESVVQTVKAILGYADTISQEGNNPTEAKRNADRPKEPIAEHGPNFTPSKKTKPKNNDKETKDQELTDLCRQIVARFVSLGLREQIKAASLYREFKITNKDITIAIDNKGVLIKDHKMSLEDAVMIVLARRKPFQNRSERVLRKLIKEVCQENNLDLA